MLNRRAMMVIGTVALMLNAAGCASLRDPTVTVIRASAADATNDAMVVNFMLELTNPNDNASLRLNEFDYEVKVDGKKVFSGVRSAEATLASKDQRHIRLPVVLDYKTLGWTAETAPGSAKFAIAGTLNYVKPGEVARVMRDMGFPLPTARFKDAGEVQLR